MTESDGENETSLMDKYKKLSDHVSVLERKLMATENLQLLIREKDEEIKRLRSIIHQYKLGLQRSKQHLMKPTEITRKEYGSCTTTDVNVAVYAKHHSHRPTTALTHNSDGHKVVQNQSEDVLCDHCEPVGIQKCAPVLSSQIQNIGPEVKSKPFTFAAPVSRDLVDKLMQQNARLKKALRDMLVCKHSVESRGFKSDVPDASDVPMDCSLTTVAPT